MKIRVLFILSFVLIFILGCEKKTKTVQEEVIRPVKLIDVKSSNNTISGTYPATIQPANLRSLSFQVSGKVNGLFVKEAQKVKANQTLPSLDAQDYINQRNQARNNFIKQKLNLKEQSVY